MKRILVATDGSDGSNRAVDYAAGLSHGLGAELLIVNIVGGYGLPDDVFRRFTRSQSIWFDELLQAHSAEILGHARDRALRLGASPVEIESRTGNVAQSIKNLAEGRGADAIVVGRRGAGGVVTHILGNIAHKLVSIADQPVIVAP